MTYRRDFPTKGVVKADETAAKAKRRKERWANIVAVIAIDGSSKCTVVGGL